MSQMSLVAGIDVGSTTIKIVLMEDNKLIDQAITPTGSNCKETTQKLMMKLLEKNSLSMDKIGYIVSTGYGRRLVPFTNEVVTEITANTNGALWLAKNKGNIQTIIDIGGQDTKIISLDTRGKMRNFIMNDKCAAGCGRFLEVMATRLEVDLEEFGKLSLLSQDPMRINSTCTVFSESEVISLIAQGKKKEDIIAGLCEAISHRVLGLAKQIGIRPIVFLDGGVVKNQGVIKFLEEEIEGEVFIPEKPEFVIALGAAIIALEKAKKI